MRGPMKLATRGLGLIALLLLYLVPHKADSDTYSYRGFSTSKECDKAMSIAAANYIMENQCKYSILGLLSTGSCQGHTNKGIEHGIKRWLRSHEKRFSKLGCEAFKQEYADSGWLIPLRREPMTIERLVATVAIRKRNSNTSTEATSIPNDKTLREEHHTR
jgi:hypothetical protein